MVKDKLLKLLFIPILGAIIPYLSGIITYERYSLLELSGIQLYFFFMSWSIWSCSAWLHHKIRYWFPLNQNIFIKISTVSLTNSFFGAAIAAVLTIIWYRFSLEIFAWTPYLLCVILSNLAVIIFTLVYEILYLSRERIIDNKIVDQLDRERTVAELANLKNELEPHFIFNSLNTLSYLILFDQKTAHVFNSKLAIIYKYFLINKSREVISLWDELEFIEDYIYLLQLRYDNKISLLHELKNQFGSNFLILPFALQITVENAIKHNEFNEDKPLNIWLDLVGEALVVKNIRCPKPYNPESTGIGLRNLSMRYRLISGKDITIQSTENEFMVQLPLIQKYQQL